MSGPVSTLKDKAWRRAAKTGVEDRGFRLGRSRARTREALMGYVAISPWLVGFLLLVAGPVIYSFILTFHRWEIITPARWVGFDNFRRLFTDPLVGKALANTAYYTALAVPLHVSAALLAAVLLNSRVRGRNVYRLLLYLPTQMPLAATAVLWFFIFSPEFGLANGLLGALGMERQLWLWDPDLVKLCLVIIATWRLGNAMLVFLAGLQGVPDQLYEAAEIDGVGPVRRFFHITIPMISPIVLFNLIMDIIQSFQVFTVVLMTTDGGPANSSLMMVLYVYDQGFGRFRMGYASLLAWVLLSIVLGLTLIQLLLSRMWVYYEGGKQ